MDPLPPYMLADDELLRQCRVHTYRAGGPGGQKRNKTDSAVRIVHLPTGVTAVAADSRSQHDNRRIALRRLREALAIEVRSPETFTRRLALPEIQDLLARPGRVRVKESNPQYPLIAGLWLDALDLARGQVSEAAESLGLSTSRYVSFLADHPHLWAAANRLRQKYGLAALKKA